MKLLLSSRFWAVFFLVFFGLGPASAQVMNFNLKQEPAASEEAEKDSLMSLDEGEKKAQEAIKEEKAAVTNVKKEAEKIQEEKAIIAQEAKTIEKAAEVAQKEAELLKKEAQMTKDSETLKRAKELSAEAERLKQEAALAQEKLILAEEKARVAEESLNAQLLRIESLEKELSAAKLRRAIERPILEKVARAFGFVLIGLVLYIILKILLRHFNRIITNKDAIRETEAILRMKTISKIFHWLGNIMIVGVVTYMVLGNLGFDMAPLLAGAGIIGLAFGFGGQYLIRDLINGVFILIEGQYRVNDVIKVNEYGGLVEDINLRVTTLRDLEGRVIIIPNGEVKTVINYTKGFAQALFDIGVAYKENVDRVMEVIKDIGQDMRKDPYFGRLILADLEMFGVDDFGSSQVTIKFRVKTLPIKQWEVSREFKRRLKNRFDELGIEIPFPHHTLYWGAGEDNDWLRQFAAKMGPGEQLTS
jgi:moderate conductance mechanosensitive channel